VLAEGWILKMYPAAPTLPWVAPVRPALYYWIADEANEGCPFAA